MVAKNAAASRFGSYVSRPTMISTGAAAGVGSCFVGAGDCASS